MKLRQSDQMNCRAAREGLTEYLENALPADQRQGLEVHLTSCYECASFLDEFRRTIQHINCLPHEKMPDQMRSTLLKALQQRSPA